ncbi:MFS transporter [Rhodalgimonas zhirmunskyi]|uniref:MFS transporter n=1 Tax=Rhodalgimonas zhirmunskyi TaxID=2964767 RepID=A0AAJ1U7W2_9RHOB|nr:MFS transporter [Rhodoalgimonas zhirmunskyi]MDQ2092713.1 MFS transporter [Rhodoalgimonas zhirmunskyi]
MVRQLFPISALLLGSALLLFAGGINSLLLPVRGTSEGFSAASLGLLGTGWAIGYVLGCWWTPRLVGRVGHVRSFGVMSSFAGVALLMSLLFLTPYVWVPLRGLSGFCFAGAAMIVESWLSERADATSRGKVFGVYTMVNLGASTAGQLVLTTGDTSGYLFFVLGAIFYSLALVPTAISSSVSPRPLVSVKLDLRALWRNSPVAVFGVFCVGISNSAFGTLAAVYADRAGLALASLALFASLPVLAGALTQVPVGFLSDRFDRRKVLLGVAFLALAVDMVFLVLQPEDRMLNLVLSATFGAAIYAMYPVIIAHANDHADDGHFIQTSGGLLMIFGMGSIFGPAVAGFAMSGVGQQGLFLTTAAAHLGLILFVMVRVAIRAPVAEEEKSDFVMAPSARGATPETAALAVGEEELGEEAGDDEAAAEKSEDAESEPRDPVAP